MNGEPDHPQQLPVLPGKTLFCKNVTVNGALSLQDGGTAPTTGITVTGWQVGKNTIPGLSLMQVGAESQVFSTTDPLAVAAFSAGSCWRSELAYTGSFSNTDWNIVLRVRAASNGSGQQGKLHCRLWKSKTADGAGAVELTSAVLVGSNTAGITQSTPGTSTITWTPPGSIIFNGEYLWVQCAWEITTTASNAAADVLFFIDVTANVQTPEFSTIPQQWVGPALVDDGENVPAPSLWAAGPAQTLGAVLVDAPDGHLAPEIALPAVRTLEPSLVLADESGGPPEVVLGPAPQTIAGLLHDDADAIHVPVGEQVWFLRPDFFDSADEVEKVHYCEIVTGELPGNGRDFPMVGFIDRWTDAEYNLFRTRMRGVTFMGPALIKKWDIALATGYLDISDPMLPMFKQQLIEMHIISAERADVIFEGIV